MKDVFVPGKIYSRKSIHDKYKGNRQSGISTPAEHPYIFIFSGKTGHQHGYVDQWDEDGTFLYTGEGQIGDMSYIKGNLALREHLSNGKRVFLFEIQPQETLVKYAAELEVFHYRTFQAPDRAGNMRRAIRFSLKRKDSIIDTPLMVEEPAAEYQVDVPNVTERKGLVTSRVGQGPYRKRIMKRWDYKCAVTGFNDTRILIASHIVPWRNCSNQQRVDVNNGILLSPLYDALFDRHLISFKNNGRIILSSAIPYEMFQKAGVTGNEVIRDFRPGNFKYIEEHRAKLLD
jgi:5-methylcytosine-specific restriction enzyme A